jgi:hypothetical protein
MRTTKKLTISAMVTAIGSALMAIGAAVEVLDMALAATASLMLVLIVIEVGFPYPWLVWASSGLLTYILFSGSTIWIMYLLFGAFPILKYYIEKLKRPFWIPLKLAYFAPALFFANFLCILLFGLSMFGKDNIYWKIGITVVFFVAFFAYDRLLTLFARLYNEKYRHRFRHLFK